MTEQAQKIAKVQTPFKRLCSQFAESPVALVGLVVLLAVIFVAVFAPLISPQNPYDLSKLDLMESV